MDSITQEQTLIAYMSPEKREEEVKCKWKEPTQQKLLIWWNM
jgi:hypothetical protein